MADDKKLFNTEEAIDNSVSQFSGDAIGEPKLIEKNKSASSLNSDERFETLYYAERYRQRLRRGRTSRASDDTDARVANLRKAEEETKRRAMEREESEAKLHNDRISALLSRLDSLGNKDDSEKNEGAALDTSEEITPLCHDVNIADETCDVGAERESHIITVDSGIKSEILHIDGLTIGGQAHSAGSELDSLDASSPKGISCVAPDGEKHGTGVAFVPLKRHSQDSEATVNSAPVRRNLSEGARFADSSVLRNSVFIPRTEAEHYPDPEPGRHADAESRLYTDPERVGYSDTERRLYTDPERVGYADTERRLYTDPERVPYAEPEIKTYADPERTGNSYPAGNTGESYADSAYVSIPILMDTDLSSPYPEMHTYGSEDGALRQATEVTSPYPEAVDRFIRRKGGDEGVRQYAPRDAYDTRGMLRSYPDPEFAENSQDTLSTDAIYPEPVQKNQGYTRRLTAKEKRAIRREEKRLMLDDAIRFEKESRDGGFTPFDTPDPEHTEYLDSEGREYPDPEHRMQSLARDYGDYAIDAPSTYTDNDSYADVQPEESFNPRAIRRFVKRTATLDGKRISERYLYRLRELKLELRGAEMSFADKKGGGVRTEREIKADISQLKAECRRERRRAKILSRVCRSVLLTNFATCKIKKKADRATLVELRSELLRLLTEKYQLNECLVSIYTGTDRNESTGGRFSAEMKGKRRAHKLQKRIRRDIEANRVSPAYTKKIYALMDEYVALSGELERISFSLKRERPRGALKRELKRLRRKLKRKLSRIADNIEYYKKRGIERAEDRRTVRRNVILGWAVLGLIVALGILVFVFRAEILGYISSLTAGGA